MVCCVAPQIPFPSTVVIANFDSPGRDGQKLTHTEAAWRLSEQQCLALPYFLKMIAQNYCSWLLRDQVLIFWAPRDMGGA